MQKEGKIAGEQNLSGGHLNSPPKTETIKTNAIEKLFAIYFIIVSRRADRQIHSFYFIFPNTFAIHKRTDFFFLPLLVCFSPLYIVFFLECDGSFSACHSLASSIFALAGCLSLSLSRYLALFHSWGRSYSISFLAWAKQNCINAATQSNNSIKHFHLFASCGMCTSMSLPATAAAGEKTENFDHNFNLSFWSQ